jgi:hypothetical protein
VLQDHFAKNFETKPALSLVGGESLVTGSNSIDGRFELTLTPLYLVLASAWLEPSPAMS